MRFFGFIRFHLILLRLCVLYCNAKICKRDQSIDTGGTSTIYFCCSDYVPLRQSCIECPKGFRVEPEKKDKCLVCSPKNYGLKCAFDCSCSSSERCDNVDGCVSKEHNKECPPGYKVDGAECVPCASGFYGVKCLLECDCKDYEWCNATFGCISSLEVTSEINSGQDSTLSEDADIPEDSIFSIIISGISGCVIFVVTITVTGIAIYKKVKSTKISGQTEQPVNPRSSNEGPYEEIDENLMDNLHLINTNNTHPTSPQRNREENDNANGGYLEPISMSADRLFVINKDIKSTQKVGPSVKPRSFYEGPYEEIDENLMDNIDLIDINNTHQTLPQRNREENENANGGYLEPISMSADKLFVINKNTKSTQKVGPSVKPRSFYEGPYEEIDENLMNIDLIDINNTHQTSLQGNREENENENGGYLEPISKLGDKHFAFYKNVKLIQKVGLTEQPVIPSSFYESPYEEIDENLMDNLHLININNTHPNEKANENENSG